MEKLTATTVFESLSSGIRLDVYRLLVRKGPDGLVAGEIACSLDVPPTNLSFHLKALTHARLLTVVQEGRFQRYRANIPLMLDLIAYLTEECCAGHPEKCLDLRAASACAPAVLPPLPPLSSPATASLPSLATTED
jgi:DNA-binding transcriptional ArsR family regulator